jgi:Cytosol aminopeptidase family, N-terminal domain
MPQLALAPGPIERIRADVAVVPLFAGERPLRAAAGRVDWRLCGRLSHLLAAGRLAGAIGEAVLIPGGGGMCALRVLGVGAGDRDQIDAALFERWVDDALARARSLAARRAVIALPELAIALGERLTVVAKSVARIELPEVVEIAPEPSDAPGALDWLRGAARRARPEGLEIAAPVESSSAPHGATHEPSRTWSSQESAGRSTR